MYACPPCLLRPARSRGEPRGSRHFGLAQRLSRWQKEGAHPLRAYEVARGQSRCFGHRAGLPRRGVPGFQFPVGAGMQYRGSEPDHSQGTVCGHFRGSEA